LAAAIPRRKILLGSVEVVMDEQHGRFVWYELLTTDRAGAKTFYADDIGWDSRDASANDFAYSLFVAGEVPLGGLMDLPAEALRMGATPRWVGYLQVPDVDDMTTRLRRLGGSVYVPPTNSNIGRIAIVADPQTATFALVEGLTVRSSASVEGACVGWHELLASDGKKAFSFYRELFGWQSASAEAGGMDGYQLFSTGGHIMGGMFTKQTQAPVPFWLYYFSVSDVGVAAERVQAGGGRILQGPIEIPGGSAIIRCIDAQGAMFALQGARRAQDAGEVPTTELAWATEWGGFASRGRLIAGPEAQATRKAGSQAKPQAEARSRAPVEPKKPKR
jgi:predicted enzyme related to lactoylglutathione lyase